MFLLFKDPILSLGFKLCFTVYYGLAGAVFALPLSGQISAEIIKIQRFNATF